MIRADNEYISKAVILMVSAAFHEGDKFQLQRITK